MVQLRRRNVLAALLITSFVLFGLLSTSALADTHGNPDAAAACRNGNYVNWTDANGNAFTNVGQCVGYAAQGGQLVAPVTAPTLNVSVGPVDGSPGACLVTVSLAGFSAGSAVYPTFQDWWNIGGTLDQIDDTPWTSPYPITLDASGSGSMNFTNANNVVQSDGSYVVTQIVAGGLSWGPNQITC